jgi:hypothetical protein
MKTITKTKTTKTQSPESIKEIICAVIRVGRLANAVAFAKRAHRDAVIHPSQIRRRQIHQSTFLMAGYLYEAMQLIQDLTPKFGLAPHSLIFCCSKSIMDQKYREIITEFNFSPAFHQDIRSDRKLDELNPETFDLNALSVSCDASEEIAFLHYPVIYKFYTAIIAETDEGPVQPCPVHLFLKVDVTSVLNASSQQRSEFIRCTTRKLEGHTLGH